MDKLNIPFNAYKGKEPYIFISYSHKDTSLVFDIITEFHNLGYNIWYDEGIDPGNEWPEEVSVALKGCSLFIVFISENSVSSRNVRNEINLALNKNLPFLAIHLEDAELIGGLDLQMGSIQAIMKYRIEDNEFYHKANQSIERLGVMPAKNKVFSASVASDITIGGICEKCGGTGQETYQRQTMFGYKLAKRTCKACKGKGDIILKK